MEDIKQSKPSISIDKQAFNRDRLVTNDANYLPFKRVSESRLGNLADHCLQVILDHSESARADFLEIILAFKSPGCFSLMASYIDPVKARQFQVAALMYDQRNDPQNKPPNLEIKVDTRLFNPDTQHLKSCIDNFILNHFNRKSDLENENPKVTPDPEKARYLISIISVRAIIKAFDIDIAKYEREDNRQIMATRDLKTRALRIKKQQMIRNARENGLVLIHDSKLYSDAVKWYGSRVLFSGPEEFSRETYKKTGEWTDPRNIDKDILFCDLATGYPRRK